MEIYVASTECVDLYKSQQIGPLPPFDSCSAALIRKLLSSVEAGNRKWPPPLLALLPVGSGNNVIHFGILKSTSSVQLALPIGFIFFFSHLFKSHFFAKTGCCAFVSLRNKWKQIPYCPLYQRLVKCKIFLTGHVSTNFSFWALNVPNKLHNYRCLRLNSKKSNTKWKSFALGEFWIYRAD